MIGFEPSDHFANRTTTTATKSEHFYSDHLPFPTMEKTYILYLKIEF